MKDQVSTSPQIPHSPETAGVALVPLLARAPTVADVSSWRARLVRHQAAGRVVLIWAIAFAAMTDTTPFLGAVGQSAIVAATWLAIGYRTAQAFQAMTFAIGSYAVAATASLGGLAVISAVNYWVPAAGISRTSLVVTAVAGFLVVGTWDFLAQHTARPPRRVLIVGGGPPTARLLADLDRERDETLEVIGVVDDQLDASIRGRAPYGGPMVSLPETVRRLSPQLIVVAVPTGRPEVFAQLLGVADEGFQIVGLPEIYEFTFGRLPVEDLTSAWFMSVLHAYNRPTNRLAKRAFDIVVAVIGLVVAAPLLPLIAVVVKRTPGPLLYRQQRLGEYGKTFPILKFRSMRIDAEAPGEAQWASANDPRIIPGGRLLRLLRLDELPQLWNVLRGEMSIVGPRPERPEFIAHLEAEVRFWTHRHLLKPGITGWAQIRAGYAADALGTAEKLSYDLWYLRHRSLVLDAMICLKTLPRMATFRGAR